MSPSLRRLISSTVFGSSRKDSFADLNRDKKDLLDFARQRLSLKSFADLGGVWGVDGGYTFYALQKEQIEQAFLVDTDFTDNVIRKKADHPALQLIEGNFGSEETIKKIGCVDGAIFFDT